MAIQSIIDTHLHLWDPSLLRYPWLDGNPLLNRAYLLRDYRDATGEFPIEAMVFVQCEVAVAAFGAEANWVAHLATLDPRIKAMVAWAPLEKGAAVREDLAGLKSHSILRGVRRIIQFETDLDFCRRPGFVEGVKSLSEFDLSFDICIDERHLPNVIKLVQQAPNVRMVVDHIGKPAIKAGSFDSWAKNLSRLAEFPNVYCKISGVATEADHLQWTPEQLTRYVEFAIHAFGWKRAHGDSRFSTPTTIRPRHEA